MQEDNNKMTSFRHGEFHDKIIKHAMDINLETKSEAIRTILEEWLYYVASKEEE